MERAYGWAFERPERKVWYNFVVTAFSALIALLIGGVGAARTIGEYWRSKALLELGALQDYFTNLGFVTFAILTGAWIAAIVVQRLREQVRGCL